MVPLVLRPCVEIRLPLLIRLRWPLILFMFIVNGVGIIATNSDTKSECHGVSAGTENWRGCCCKEVAVVRGVGGGGGGGVSGAEVRRTLLNKLSCSSNLRYKLRRISLQWSPVAHQRDIRSISTPPWIRCYSALQDYLYIVNSIHSDQILLTKSNHMAPFSEN